jgi:type VI secretion system secreted protein Hcp
MAAPVYPPASSFNPPCNAWRDDETNPTMISRLIAPAQTASRIRAIVLACVLLLIAPAAASARVFLELPGVPGESRVTGFENQIDVDSFQFGVSNPVLMGTEKVKGKPTFSEINVTKKLDQSSPALLLRTATMAAFPYARVRVTSPSAAGEATVLRYCFTNVQITSFSQSTGGSVPIENVRFSYGTIVQSYTPQDGGKGDVFTAGWDVLGNLQFGSACDK